MPLCPEAVGSCAFTRTWGMEGQRLSPSLLAEQGRACCPVMAVLLPQAHSCPSPASALLAARVGPSVPRQDRPVREGTRVASIETGLAAAAAKLSQQVRGCLGRRSCQQRRALCPAAELCPSPVLCQPCIVFGPASDTRLYSLREVNGIQTQQCHNTPKHVTRQQGTEKSTGKDEGVRMATGVEQEKAASKECT